MATVHFTANLRRHVDCPPQTVGGGTLREVLDAALRDHALLRGYVLDDQGRIRKHVVVFINDEIATDKNELSDPVPDDGEVWVMQALSGG